MIMGLRVSSRLQRVAKLVAIGIAATVVLVAMPILWVETTCVAPRQSAPVTSSLLDPAHRRDEVNTYLTYPEWSIVHAYEDLAAVQRRSSESDFDYFGSIRRFWSSLCSISRLASARGTISGEYKLMLYTIGISFAGEMGVKGLYEKSIGRVTSWISSARRTPEDAFALAVADDYAKFLRQVPWYEYPFGRTLGRFWTETPLWGGNIIRKIERRIALSLEWGLKSLYAKVIAVGAASSPAPLRIRSVVVNLSADDLAADARLTLVERRGDKAIIETDRYATLTDIIRKLAARGLDFSEIAGNQNIMVTVFAKDPVLSAEWGVKTLFAVPVEARPGWQRLVVDVRVGSLAGFIRALDRSELVLDHVYDY